MEDWKSIGKEWRPAPFWSWNDKLDEAELRRQIREMADKGWGGYFMHSRVGLVTGYLSEDWMNLVRACAEEAKATNTWAWLYDEDKWPSGFAGGLIPAKDPAFRTKLLVLLKKNEITEDDSVLAETRVEDTEYVICRRISPLGNLWFNGTCYVDLMNPDAVRAFIESTHEEYKKAVGEYFGREIPGIFTDEPAYTYPTKVPFVPWSDCLPEYFQSTKGYDILQHLEQLFFDKGDYRRVRFDFYDTATRLFRESFTRQYYEWCEDNGLIMTGHFMAEDNLHSQTAWIGAAMPHYKHMHWPGIDKLGRHLEQVVTVKQVSSAVEQLGKERAFCEVFGCIGQQSSFLERKWIADWEAVLGIGYVNHHLSLYSMRGERKRDYPANLFYQQPWWEDERGFADYIGRLSKAATEGTREVRILVLHPLGSYWSEYSPLHIKSGSSPEQIAYDQPFQTLSRRLLEEKLDYHYGDEILIEEEGSVKDALFKVGRHEYNIVVVPPSLTLRTGTWDLLNRFADAGGTLLFIRPTPGLADARQSAPDLPNQAKVVDSIESAIAELDSLCRNRTRVRDLITREEARSIYLCVRDVDSSRRILMANTDIRRECKIEVSIPLTTSSDLRFDDPAVVAIDLVDGSPHLVPFETNDGNAVVKMTIAPAGSLLLVLTEGANLGAELVDCLDTGRKEAECKSQHVVLGCGATLGEEPESVTLADTSSFKTEILDENVLPLERVSLWLDGRQVLDNAPIAQAWHDHFYAADEGTPFRAEYSFEVRSVPAGGVTAAIEVAENLDRVLCNGVEVRPLKHKSHSGAFDNSTSWKDVNFTRVPIPESVLHEGKNTLTIEGKKSNNITGPGCHRRVDDFREHTPTEVEVAYIVGNFVVGGFDYRDFHICDPKSPCAVCASRQVDHADLTKSGYPFYTGRVRLSTAMSLPDEAMRDAAGGSDHGRVFLSLGSVNAASVSVSVNGKPAGTLYWSPHTMDVTELLKTGENLVELVASTTLFNCFGPGWIAGIEDTQYVSPRTFVEMSRYTDRRKVLPFGVGEARLFIA